MFIGGNKFWTLRWPSIKMSQRPPRRQRPFVTLPSEKPRPIELLSLGKHWLEMPLVSGRPMPTVPPPLQGRGLLLYGYQEGRVPLCQTGLLHPTIACQGHAMSGAGSHRSRGEILPPSLLVVEQPYRACPQKHMGY